MLSVLTRGAKALEITEPCPGFALGEDAIWIDLLNPSRAEELACEAALAIELPTREEMTEIETSSRLYRDGGASVMTTPLLAHSDTLQPKMGPVTFILTGHTLITIRYLEPKAFTAAYAHIDRHPAEWTSGVDVFFGLMDTIIDRLADALEHAVVEIDALSASVFRNPEKIDFRRVVNQLGRSQDINVKIRESAAGLMRLLIFAAGSEPMTRTADARDRLTINERDLASVVDHSGHLSDNISFMLDSALGLINIEQNAIMKIVSAAAVIFLPPTLIAGYFGMNFRHMPELEWRLGEPLSLLLMIASMVGPLIWMRRKGWF